MDEYPNSSDAWSVEPPEERKEVERKEREKVTSSIGVIQDVVDWLEASAEFYGSIDALDIKADTDPTAALVAMSTAKNMRAAYQSKLAGFRSQFAKYLKEKQGE